MTAPIKVGEGYIEIAPKLTKLDSVNSIAQRQFKTTGRLAATSFADAFDTEISKRLSKTFNSLRRMVIQPAASAGQLAGQIMGEDFDDRFNAALDKTMARFRAKAQKEAAAAGSRAGLSFGRSYQQALNRSGIGRSARIIGIQAGNFFGGEFLKAVNRSLILTSDSVRVFGNRLQAYGQNWSLYLTAPWVAGAAAAVDWGIQTGAAIQRAQIGLTQLLANGSDNAKVIAKSTALANSQLAILRRYAADTAFEFAPMANGVQRLVAAGVNAKEATRWMQILGDTAASFGAGTDEMNRAIIAVTQSMDAERITAQDMNQLQNAGIPIWKILGDIYHKNRLELLQMAQEGDLQSKDVWPKVFARMNKLYAGNAKAMAQMVPLEVLRNQIEQFKNDLSDVVNGTNSSFQKIDPTIPNQLKGIFTTFGNILKDLVPIFSTALKAALPFINKVLLKVDDFLIKVNQSGPSGKKFAAFFSLAVAAAGPLMVALGFVVRGFSSIISSLRLIPFLLRGVNNLVTAMTKLGRSAGTAAKNTKDFVKDFVKEVKDGTFLNRLIGTAANLEIKFRDAFKTAQKELTKFGDAVDNTKYVIRAKVIAAGQVISNRAGSVKIAEGFGGKAKAVASIGKDAIGAGIKGIVGVIAPLASIIGKVLGPAMRAFGRVLDPLINKLSKAFVPLALALAKALGPGLAVAIAALTPAIISLTPAFSDLGKTLGPILGTLGKITANLIKEFAPILVQLAQKLAPVIQQVGVFAGQLIKQLAPILEQLMKALIPIVGIIGSLFINVLKALIPVVIQVLKAIQPLIPVLGKSLTQILLALTPIFIQLLNAILPLIPALTPLIVLGVKLTTVLLKLVTPIIKVAAAITSWLIRKAISPLIRWISDLVGWISNHLLSAFNNIPHYASVVWSALKKFPGQMKNLGHDIMMGLWNGLKAASGWVKGQFSNLIHDVIPGIAKKILKINSPSLVMAEIGQGVIEGLNLGMNQESPSVVATVTRVTNSITSTASSAATAATPTAAPATAVSQDFKKINAAATEGLNKTKTIFSSTTKAIATDWSANTTNLQTTLQTGITKMNTQTSVGLNSVYKTTASRMKNVVSSIKSAASQASDAWKSMAHSMNSSTESLVNVSYGKGVRGMVGAMAKLAGTSNPLPAMHFATGGVVPGYAPGRDVVPAVLSPGEGVLRPEVVRWLGAETIHQWNWMARHNKFANGGVVDGASWVQSHQNAPYSGYEAALKAGLSAVVSPTLAALKAIAGAFGNIQSGDMKSQYPAVYAWGRHLDKLAMAGAGKVLQVARSQIGQGDRGGVDNNLNKYNGYNGEPWCADFVSWVVGKAGASRAYWGLGGFRRAPAVATWRHAAMGSGRWDSFGHARPGDIITFGGGAHIGLVEGQSRGGGVTTIEGNHGPLVTRVHRLGADGVGHPLFARVGKYVHPWPGSVPMGSADTGPIGDEFANGLYKTVAQIKALAKTLLKAWGWGSQWSAMNYIISHESGWNPLARNPSSGAYGLGQALPPSKMAPYGKDWRTNPVTQLRWWHDYVKGRYGDPNRAAAFWRAHHWYEKGAWEIPDTQPAVLHKGEMVLPSKQAEAYRSALKARGISEAPPRPLSERPIEIHQHGVKDTKKALVSAFSYIDTMYGNRF